MKENLELMAAYNQTMNQRVYESTSSLSKDELDKERGAFFGSISGTLNHILVGDIIWLQRFAGHEAGFESLDSVRLLAAPNSLGSCLYEDFAELTAARRRVDAVMVQFTAELSESVIASVLMYNDTAGRPFKRRLGFLVQHLFNHQTHHRGQVSTLLFQAGVDIGMTDLMMCIPCE